jgi:hypothetical protein
MADRYAVLSEILSDSSVVYNVYDMTNVSEGPVYEGVDIRDAADWADAENEMNADPEIGDGMTDAEADADVLRSAGWGTDEDYGIFDDRDMYDYESY